MRPAERPADLPLVQSAGPPLRNHLYSSPSKNLWIEVKSGKPVENVPILGGDSDKAQMSAALHSLADFHAASRRPPDLRSPVGHMECWLSKSRTIFWRS